MASGKHRRKRSSFWVWFPAILTVLWLSIWASIGSEQPQPVFQRPLGAITQPQHIIHPRAFQPPHVKKTVKVLTIASHQTLWSIAYRYCGNGTDYKNIMKANGIKTWRIYPGERIHVIC